MARAWERGVTAIQGYRRERGITALRGHLASGRRPASTVPPKRQHSEGFKRPSAVLAFSSS